MTLCTFWEEYKNNRNYETEERLCNRIGQLSEIVLAWLNIGKDRDFYEDLKQSGYVCFFETVKRYYDPKRGGLEGLFMQAFKKDVIDFLREHNYSFSFDITRIPDERGTPVDIAEANDFDWKLQQQLTNEEYWIYVLFLKYGITEEEEIRQFFNGSKVEVAYLLDSIRQKFERLLGEK